MPMLTQTDFYGTIAWLGRVDAATETIASEPVERVDLDWGGIVGEAHSGLTRPACVRVRAQYAKDTEIANTRQISILSAEELAEVADRLGIPTIEPEWVGANMIVEGIPDFTLIPPNTRLIFESGASLVIDMENAPCRYPAELIEAAHPGHGKSFPAKAEHKRGVTAWVERPGPIGRGDKCRVHVPPRRLWPHG